MTNDAIVAGLRGMEYARGPDTSCFEQKHARGIDYSE